jgi:hypothetical protein
MASRQEAEAQHLDKAEPLPKPATTLVAPEPSPRLAVLLVRLKVALAAQKQPVQEPMARVHLAPPVMAVLQVQVVPQVQVVLEAPQVQVALLGQAVLLEQAVLRGQVGVLEREVPQEQVEVLEPVDLPKIAQQYRHLVCIILTTHSSLDH